MSKKFRTLLVGIMLTFGLVTSPVVLEDVSYAAGSKASVCEGINSIKDAGTEQCDPAATGAGSLGTFINNIINMLLFIIGAVAVIMIIIGGIRYVTSNGDSAQTTSAKNTVLYAVVGLVVALMAFAIVNFVLRAI